jgi:hypothetical protein
VDAQTLAEEGEEGDKSKQMSVRDLVTAAINRRGKRAGGEIHTTGDHKSVAMYYEALKPSFDHSEQISWNSDTPYSAPLRQRVAVHN